MTNKIVTILSVRHPMDYLLNSKLSVCLYNSITIFFYNFSIDLITIIILKTNTVLHHVVRYGLQASLCWATRGVQHWIYLDIRFPPVLFTWFFQLRLCATKLQCGFNVYWLIILFSNSCGVPHVLHFCCL